MARAPSRGVIGEVANATRHGEMPSYVAAPSRPAASPGVVIPDFTGMSHDLRNQADWLASEGFLAAAADLDYWGSRPRCLRTIIRGGGLIHPSLGGAARAELDHFIVRRVEAPPLA